MQFTLASPGGRGGGDKVNVKGLGDFPSGVQEWSPGAGLGAKPPEAEKHDINFALRITLVNAYRPFYSSLYHHVCNWIFKK